MKTLLISAISLSSLLALSAPARAAETNPCVVRLGQIPNKCEQKAIQKALTTYQTNLDDMGICNQSSGRKSGSVWMRFGDLDITFGYDNFDGSNCDLDGYVDIETYSDNG